MNALAGRGLDDEVELMALIAGGDIRAFEQLYDRTANAAFSLAMRVVGDHGTAADVTQESFLEFWRNRERYTPGRGSPRAWLLGIVRHRGIDALRLRARRGGHPRDEAGRTERASAENTEDQAIANDEAVALRAALEQLPEAQLTVMNLAYFRGPVAGRDRPAPRAAARHRQGTDAARAEAPQGLRATAGLVPPGVPRSPAVLSPGPPGRLDRPCREPPPFGRRPRIAGGLTYAPPAPQPSRRYPQGRRRASRKLP